MDYYGKDMVARYEQVELFSPAEYRRRIAGVREIMKQKNVDTALFLEPAEETYDHWLTGRRFLDYLIVPAQGECFGILYRLRRRENRRLRTLYSPAGALSKAL